MARNPAEIQADVTDAGRVIERQIETIVEREWTPFVLLAAAAVAGFLLSPVPVRRLADSGSRLVDTGLRVANALAMVERFRNQHHRRAA
jgi:hypothetical protein